MHFCVHVPLFVLLNSTLSHLLSDGENLHIIWPLWKQLVLLIKRKLWLIYIWEWAWVHVFVVMGEWQLCKFSVWTCFFILIYSTSGIKAKPFLLWDIFPLSTQFFSVNHFRKFVLVNELCFHLRLRTYKKNHGLLTFLSKYVQTKSLLVLFPKQWFSVIFDDYPCWNSVHRYLFGTMVPLVEINSQTHSTHWVLSSIFHLPF